MSVYSETVTRPIITLITDFGISDHFVGVMKGVILSIQPAAQVIDISHNRWMRMDPRVGAGPGGVTVSWP